MTGLETYAATKKTFVGIDWLNLASGALKTTGGAFGGGGASGGGDAAAAVEKARLEEQKKAAEQSASNWKMIGIAGVVVVLLGGFTLYQRSQPAGPRTR